MINHEQIRLAARAHALTLSVATTGAMSLAATADGYARTTGSFITDGFAVGMEVTPDGFTETTVCRIIGVTALTLSIAGGRTVEAAGTGRTLTVELPSRRAFENVTLTVGAPEPTVTETYLPGALTKSGLGARGTLEATPLYVLRFAVPINTGVGALARYADACIEHFAPGQTVTLTNGDTARVRSDLCPYPSQLLYPGDGTAAIAVTIPLRLTTANSI